MTSLARTHEFGEKKFVSIKFVPMWRTSANQAESFPALHISQNREDCDVGGHGSRPYRHLVECSCECFLSVEFAQLGTLSVTIQVIASVIGPFGSISRDVQAKKSRKNADIANDDSRMP
jgi:hypothetical protein